MKRKFDAIKQNELAEEFRSLHHGDDTLILPNAWDSASAKIFEIAGFNAIATTSSGISWACGYADGEHIPPELMIEMTGRIAGSVNVAVTADVEAGYYKNQHEFENFIEQIIEAGAVGINLEDGDGQTNSLYDIEWQLSRLRTVRSISKRKEVNIFINARTDAMALPAVDVSEKIKTCVYRARQYQAAGADGIFVPFVKDMETVEILKKSVDLPLNLLIDKSLDITVLKQLRINRISMGGKPMLSVLDFLKNMALQLKESNEWESLYSSDITYGAMNEYFTADS